MKIRKIVRQETAKKKRVAAYVRVSTLTESQEDSFNAQVEYFTELIDSMDDWEAAGIYQDMYNQRLIQCPAHGSVEKWLK